MRYNVLIYEGRNGMEDVVNEPPPQPARSAHQPASHRVHPQAPPSHTRHHLGCSQCRILVFPGFFIHTITPARLHRERAVDRPLYHGTALYVQRHVAHSATGTGERRCMSARRADTGHRSASRRLDTGGTVALQCRPMAGTGWKRALECRPKVRPLPFFRSEPTPKRL